VKGAGAATGGDGHSGAAAGHGTAGTKTGTPKNQSPDESGYPSAAKDSQTRHERAGDRHPTPGNGGKADSSKHSHDAGEMVKPGGAPTPTGRGKNNGDGHSPEKKDSIKKDLNELTI
jgi:hypothetical protein